MNDIRHTSEDDEFIEAIAPGDFSDNGTASSSSEKPSAAEINSDKIYDEITKGLPVLDSDEKPNIQKAKHHLGRHLLLVSVYTIAVVLIAYYFTFVYGRKSTPYVSVSMNPAPPAELFADSQYGEIANEAFEKYKSGRFSECAAYLSKYMPELIIDSENSFAEDLISIYVSSVLHGVADTSIKHRAMLHIQELAFKHPENANWRVALLYLTYESEINYSEIYAKAKNGELKKSWNYSLAVVKKGVDECSKLIDMQRSALSYSQDDDGYAILAQYKAIKASLLVSQWILEGGKGGSVFPDDFGDAGVHCREHALDLVLDSDGDFKKHTIKSKDFLEIRLFIAEVIKEQGGSLLNKYYWNGKKHFSLSPLEKEINTTNKQLQKMLRNY